MKKPPRVLRCTTHHHACDCREFRFELMETALRIIHTWAAVYDDRHEQPDDAMRLIAKKCLEALDLDAEQK